MGIAVIVPIYNTEKYLKDCLDSIVNQTVSFSQVILINDGSTDNSYQIAKEYESLYTNIHVYSQENFGQAVARNRGLKMVSQEYVMFLDSDDFLRKDTVEILNNEISNSKPEILYFDSEIKVENLKYKKINTYCRAGKVDEVVMSGKEYFVNYYPRMYVVSPCMVLFDVEFLRRKQIVFPKVRAYEDEVFSFKALLQAQKVKYLSEKLYVRRYRDNSTMTSSLTDNKWCILADCYLQNWKYIIENLNEFTELEIESMQIYLLKKYLELRSVYLELDKAQRGEVFNKVFQIQEKFSIYCEILYRQIQENVGFRLCRWYSRFFLELSIQDTMSVKLIDDNFKFNMFEKYQKFLSEKLGGLPLKDSGKKIGIYGTGKHTERLLKWYRYLLGSIESKLVFIDSSMNSYQSEYQGNPILNVGDLKGCVDEIIISSSEHEGEMCKKILDMYGDSYKIYRFYEIDKEDIFVSYDFFIKEISTNEKIIKG